MKKCSGCKRQKDFSEFYKHNGTKTGYRSRCKECSRVHGNLNDHPLHEPPGATKQCNTCKQPKSFDEFSHARGNKDGRHRMCRDCKSKYDAAHYKKDPSVARWSNIRRKYGLSQKEYEKMLSAQGGVCAICGREDKKKALSVDHCHTTGDVRGLLCTSCNLSIGKLDDCPETLRNAARYIDRHRGPVHAKHVTELPVDAEYF